MKRCPSCGEENTDRARFCQSCGGSLEEPDAPTADVRKVVTVVFADVTGSTALGERLDPETLRRVMSRYFDEMAAAIERHGGTVEKFIGDAVMAVFGIPRLHEDDALRSVRAAVAMREALARLNRELERDHGEGLSARIGVNTGEVVAGDSSAGQRLVTGDAVNVAARLEQAAATGEILLGESTYRLVKDAVEVEHVDALVLKGKERPVPVYRLLAVSEASAGHRRRLDSPMVGRAQELSLLEHALERVVSDRSSHLFTLMGPAGIGKSRLVNEFLRRATGATALCGRCLSYGEGITYYPLSEIVHDVAGILDGDDPATARSKLDRLLLGAPDGERVAALVAGLFGWAEPGATEDAFWAVRKLIEHLARDRPVVVVFDDIQWGQPTFLDLVEHLADWTRDAAVLLLCVARGELLELRPGWGGGKLNATSILLEALPEDETSQLVENLLGQAGIAELARDRILEAAEGNPLFVEEMLAMLIDDGLLRFEDGAWRSVEDLVSVTVPPTIHLLLAARLDRLDAEERGVIERGAIEGKVFHSGAVATLSPESARPRVPSRLLALARKELIRPDAADFSGEDAFRFRHLLIRDAAYHAMPKEQRAELHERFADWLARVARERLAEYEEILAHHLEAAFRYREELGAIDGHAHELAARAGRHLYASAVRSDEREDLPAARILLERGLELSEGPDRLETLLLLGEVVEELGDHPAAFAIADSAVTLARELADHRSELRAELLRTLLRGTVDPTHTMAMARADVEDVLDEAKRTADDELRDRALLALGLVCFFQGRTAETVAILGELTERAATMSRRARQEIGSQLRVAAYFGATPVEAALRAVERAGELQRGSMSAEAFSLRVTAGLLTMAGRHDEADAAIERSNALFEKLGTPTAALSGRQILGELLRLQGRLAEAERVFRETHEAYEALGETGYNSTVSGLLAYVLCDLGRFDEADALASRSRELSADDDSASQAVWRMAKARVLTERGAFDEALRLADEAVAINEETDYLDWQGDGLEVRGLVLAGAGRTEEARESFERALERYERKGNIVSVQRIRERLG